MNRRVLIVSPHFPPVNAADHQRVRMAIPYLPKFGWDATVLAVAPEYVQAPRDEWLLNTLPADLDVHRVKAIPVEWTRRIGMSTLSFRCRGAIRKKGNELLETGAFDLVYFSTTQVGVHRLGLRWKRQFGVPFMLDLQDPWVNDYYRQHPEVRPPGGRVKYALAEFSSRRDEPRCLRETAAVTTVSARYIDDIALRYSWIDRSRFHVLPFGAATVDYAVARTSPVEQHHINFDDGLEHWVAVGRGGEDMRTALQVLFRGFREGLATRPDRFGRIRMHFLGTDYAAGARARETVRPIAVQEGVGDYVEERPHRIPYSEAVQCLVKADGLLIIGSNDTGYNPSKVAPYLLSGRPVLSVLHDRSPAAAVVEQAGGVCLRFDEEQFPPPARVVEAFSCSLDPEKREGNQLQDLTAEAMTRKLAAIFDQAGRK